MPQANTQLVLETVVTGNQQAENALKGVKDGMDALKKAGLILAAIGAGFGAVTTASIKAAAQFEQTSVAFETLAGDAELSKQKLKELSDFAVKTPFQLEEVEQNAFLLSAMGVEMDNLIPTMRMLGDVSRGQSDVFAALSLNYGQVLTQGKLTGRELRDFAIRGIPLLSILSEELGKTRAEISEMVSDGAISADMVTAAFKSMSEEGGKFFGFMDKQSKTFNGVMSNIEDNFTRLQRQMGEALLPLAKTVAEGFQSFIQVLVDAPPIVKELISVITALVAVVATVAAGLIAWKVAGGAVVAALKLIAAGVVAVTAKFLALNPVIGALVVAVGALAAAWRFANKETEAVLAGMKEMTEQTQKTADIYAKSAEVLNGIDKERALLKQRLMQKTADLNEALEEKARADAQAGWLFERGLLSAKETARIKTERKMADFAVKQAERTLDATIRTSRRKAEEWRDYTSAVLVDAEDLHNAIDLLGREEVRRRLQMLEVMEVADQRTQLRILEFRGEVSRETIAQVEAQHQEQMALAMELKEGLIQTFSTPITQQVVVAVQDKGIPGLFNKIVTGATDFRNRFIQAVKPIDGEFEAIKKRISGVGKSTGKLAADGSKDLNKFVKDATKQFDTLREKISSIQERISDLVGDFQKEEAEDRAKLAEAIVASEDKIASLKKEKIAAQKSLRDADGADERAEAKARVAEIEESLMLEVEARERNSDLILQLEKEVTEAKRQSTASALQLAVEAFNKERAEAKAAFDEKVRLLNAELQELQGQKEDIFKIVEERNEELQKKYKKDAANFKAALDQQLEDARKIAAEILSLFAQIDRAQQKVSGSLRSRSIKGARAEGGPVTANDSFLVGEREPEIFTPRVSGTITPLSKVGGVTINISGVFGSDAAEEIGDMIVDKLTRHVAV